MANVLDLDLIWDNIVTWLGTITWSDYIGSSHGTMASIRGPSFGEDRLPHVATDLVFPARQITERAGGSKSVLMWESVFLIRIAVRGDSDQHADGLALDAWKGLQQAHKGSGVYMDMARTEIDHSVIEEAAWELGKRDNTVSVIDCTLRVYRRTT